MQELDMNINHRVGIRHRAVPLLRAGALALGLLAGGLAAIGPAMAQHTEVYIGRNVGLSVFATMKKLIGPNLPVALETLKNGVLAKNITVDSKSTAARPGQPITEDELASAAEETSLPIEFINRVRSLYGEIASPILLVAFVERGPYLIGVTYLFYKGQPDKYDLLPIDRRVSLATAVTVDMLVNDWPSCMANKLREKTKTLFKWNNEPNGPCSDTPAAAAPAPVRAAGGMLDDVPPTTGKGPVILPPKAVVAAAPMPVPAPPQQGWTKPTVVASAAPAPATAPAAAQGISIVQIQRQRPDRSKWNRQYILEEAYLLGLPFASYNGPTSADSIYIEEIASRMFSNRSRKACLKGIGIANVNELLTRINDSLLEVRGSETGMVAEPLDLIQTNSAQTNGSARACMRRPEYFEFRVKPKFTQLTNNTSNYISSRDTDISNDDILPDPIEAFSIASRLMQDKNAFTETIHGGATFWSIKFWVRFRDGTIKIFEITKRQRDGQAYDVVDYRFPETSGESAIIFLVRY
jgi:hypothetical protein